MLDFFVSYNRNDGLWAKGIAEWLKQAGYSCVIQDADFQAGSNFVLETGISFYTSDRPVAPEEDR
ncbi:MAG: TIR domain-containing protein [Desulfobacteraceae bacterium]|jgi:hypothetical protein|nr:MAG: TIR domain-containing protein [Desulfobacteraceae bacterium]